MIPVIYLFFISTTSWCRDSKVFQRKDLSPTVSSLANHLRMIIFRTRHHHHSGLVDLVEETEGWFV